METVQFLEACRTCACFYINENYVEFVHLFQPPDIVANEMLLIRAELEAWQLQVMPDDGLPQRMCVNCFNKFSSVIALRQECLEAQTRLLDAILSSSSTEGAVLCTNIEDIASMPIVLADQQQHNLVASVMNEHNNVVLPTNDASVDIPTQVTDVMPTSPDIISAQQPVAMDLEERGNLDLEEVIQSTVIQKNLQHDIDVCSDNSDAELFFSEDEQEIMNIITRTIKEPYACQFCHASTNSLFTNDEELSDHYCDVHDPNRPYNCPHCAATFRTSDKREHHLQIVHIANDLENVYTENAVHNENNVYIQNYEKHVQQIENHVQNDEHNGQIEINETAEISPTAEEPIKQISSLATTKASILKCIYCNEQVRCSTELHELNCDFEADWTCRICSIVFFNTKLRDFRAHERTHNPNQPMTCRICNRRFMRPNNLAQHEKTHFKPTLKEKLKCEQCNEDFSHAFELRRHNSDMHKCDSAFFCKICNKGFTTSAFYSRHQMQFHPKKENDNTCKDCDATFTSAVKLRHHISRSRDENGHCVDANTYELRKRPRRTTRQNGVIVCQFCAKHFTTDQELLKHLDTHNPKERPRQCTECKVRCRNIAELEQHMNVAHLQNLADKSSACDETNNSKKDFEENQTAEFPTDQRDFTQGVDNETCLYFTDESQEHSIDVYEETVNHDLITASHEYLSWPQMPVLDSNLQQTTKLNQSQHFEQASMSMSDVSMLMETNDETQAEQYLI